MMTSTTPSYRHYVKSSFSGGSGGNCVEWAFAPGGVHLRDSKNPTGPELFVSYPEWSALLTTVASDAAHPWVSSDPTGVSVRKDGQTLRFTPAEWSAFRAGVHAGECQPKAA